VEGRDDKWRRGTIIGGKVEEMVDHKGKGTISGGDGRSVEVRNSAPTRHTSAQAQNRLFCFS